MLETERLILREFEKADWEAVSDYFSDPEVYRYQRGGPYSSDQAQEYVNRAIERRLQQPRQHYEYVIVLKSESQLIGAVRLSINDVANGQGNIGYDLIRKYWGRGFGTEAAQRMINFGFNELKLHRITAGCNADNHASAHVLEKCHMRLEAHFHEDLFVKGSWRNELIYAILEQEWQPSNLTSNPRVTQRQPADSAAYTI